MITFDLSPSSVSRKRSGPIRPASLSIRFSCSLNSLWSTRCRSYAGARLFCSSRISCTRVTCRCQAMFDCSLCIGEQRRQRNNTTKKGCLSNKIGTFSRVMLCSPLFGLPGELASLAPDPAYVIWCRFLCCPSESFCNCSPAVFQSSPPPDRCNEFAPEFWIFDSFPTLWHSIAPFLQHSWPALRSAKGPNEIKPLESASAIHPAARIYQRT